MFRSCVPAFALSEATARGRYGAEGWRVRKDGTRFWAHMVIDAIRTEAGALAGFAKITRDIIERRAAAQELEKARGDVQGQWRTTSTTCSASSPMAWSCCATR